MAERLTLTREMVEHALMRARLRYQRLERRHQRRIWRQVIAREMTQPLLADGLSYHRRYLARRRRSR